MGKGGLLKTLRPYKSTLLIFALLLIIAFSIFNTQKRKLIENLEGSKGTTGTTKTTKTSGTTGTTEKSGTTEKPLTPAIKTNNKYLEVFLWYDPKKIEGKQGERIGLFELLKNNFNTENNKYVLFQTYNIEDYIEDYFMTDPKFKDLKTNFMKENGQSLEAWKKYKQEFSDLNAPVITFCVVDRNTNPHKRKCLGGAWLIFDTTLEILEMMLTGHIYSEQIGVAIDTPPLSSVTSQTR
jgi:hypothetical protein